MTKFEPLTLSQERWNRITTEVSNASDKNGVAYDVFDAGALVRECEAQAQAATDLKQLLQAEAALLEEIEAWLEGARDQAAEHMITNGMANNIKDNAFWSGVKNACERFQAELQRRRSPTGQEK